MPLCRESLAPHLLPHLLLDSIMACFKFPPVLGWALGLLSRGASLQISSICSLLLTWSQLKSSAIAAVLKSGKQSLIQSSKDRAECLQPHSQILVCKMYCWCHAQQ